MAAVDSPRPPTDEMMRFGEDPIFVGFWRRDESWDVIVERGEEGGRDGKEGVTRPYLGSGVSSCGQRCQAVPQW